MNLGILLIVIGLILLPVGIYYLINELKQHKVLPVKRKVVVYFIELVDVFTGATGVGWLLGLSIIMIIAGLILK